MSGVDEIHVVICEDRRLLREALGSYLTDGPCALSVTLAADGDDAVRAVRAGADVLLLNVEHAGDVDGLEVLQALSSQRSDVPVLVLGPSAGIEAAARAMMIGAAGFVSEDASPVELYEAVMQIAEGRCVIPDQVVGPLLRHVSAERHRRMEAERVLSTLTQRERTVLLMLGRGLTRQLIAERLGLSVNTVRTHIASVLHKLDVHTQLAAAIRGQYLLGEALTRVGGLVVEDSR